MDADIIQAGIALIIIALAGSNIWLLVGIKGAIWSQTKRINALSELLKRGEVGGSKKVR
tara:strand:- start:1111 stop:1287 length:177 start_codon:yes stop_codon:yes gene_type:complete